MNNRPENFKKSGRLSRPAALGASVIMTIQISACKTMDTGAIDAECMIFQPVKWSRRDTLRTIEQIREHNAVWDNLCHEN